MKKVIIVILMLVFGMGIEAQNNNFISLFGGLTMPSGNWTNTAYNANDVGVWNPNDPANLSSGFAGKGATFGIEGAYFVSKYFGVGGMVNYSTFGFSGLSALSAGYQGSLDVDSVATTVGPGYTMWNFMYGIYFSYPVTNKFSVTAKLLGGLTTVTTPSIAVHVWDGGVDDSTFTQHPCTANSFGYAVGIGVSYKILDYLAINLQGNYSYSKPDFWFDNTYFNTNVTRQVPEYNQPLTYMNVTLGVSYLFGAKKE